MGLLILKLLVIFSFNAEAQSDCSLTYQRVKGAGQNLSKPQDALPPENVTLAVGKPVKFENEWFGTQGKLGDKRTKFFGSHNRMLRNDGQKLIKVTYSNKTERALEPGDVLREEGDIAQVSCDTIERDCKLSYQRVKAAGQKLGPQTSMSPESVSMKIGETRTFETWWPTTSGKVGEPGKKYGSHARTMANVGDHVIRVTLNFFPMGPTGKPMTTEKILFPGDQTTIDADIAKVTCDSDRMKVVNNECSALQKNQKLWQKPDGTLNIGAYGKTFYDSEINSFSKFVVSSNKLEPVNAYLLSKLSELVYEERLAFELQHVLPATNEKFVDGVKVLHPTNADFVAKRQVTTGNFRCAFEDRTAHFFYDPSRPNAVKPKYKFFHRQHTVSLASNMFAFQAFTGDIQYTHDPELMVIITPIANYLVWRGTDDVEPVNSTVLSGNNTEIFATDLGVQPKPPEVPEMKGMLVHAGIWDSFRFVEPPGGQDLTKFLMANGGKSRPIWVTGHSLGGGQAILSGAYLKAKGFRVEGIYGFAPPRVLGNDGFKKFLDTNLANKVHRFEHSLDIVTTLWFPGYNVNIGKRHWFQVPNFRDERPRLPPESTWTFKSALEERKYPYVAKGATPEAKLLDDDMFNGDIVESANRTAASAGQIRPNMAGMFGPIIGTLAGVKDGFQKYGWLHNPQFYVFGTSAQLPSKDGLPKVIDPYPFMYKDFGYKPDFGYR